jgi:hemoglobin/transferrin/lactoferrin receptor protein
MRVEGSWNGLIGSARLVHSLSETKRWRVFAGVTQSFRSPNLSDLTRLDSARSNEIETPSPGLDEEHFVTYELGLKTAGPDWRGVLSVYHTTMDGMITRVPTGRELGDEVEVTKVNAGDGFVRGVELSGEVILSPSWSLFAAATWLEGEVDTYPTSEPVLVREPIDRMMPPTAHLGLRWSGPARNLWLEAEVSVADRQDRLSTRDQSDTQRIPPGGTPGYAVATVRGGLDIGRGLHLSAALENLTDEDYRTHGSGLNQPGRNLVLALSFDF